MATSQDVRALMNEVQSDHVRAALRRIDDGERGGFAESTRYDVLFEGKRYAPKRVIGLALEALSGEKYTPYDFKGGELSACFRTLSRLNFDVVDKVGKPIELPAPRKSSKYTKETYQLALDAVHALGGSASVQGVQGYLAKLVSGFEPTNVGPDLNMLSVNSFHRANWSVNKSPRRSDEGSPYDALFKEKHADGSVTYALYDPSQHGIWELAPVEGSSILRPRLVQTAELALVDAVRDQLEHLGDFDPENEVDGRRRMLAAIVRRQGQGKFRQQLLAAYGGRCTVTGFDATDALEAAHIRAYLGSWTNVVVNGLLLRADIHTLFDLGLLSIDPRTMRVAIAPTLRNSQYAALDGSEIRLPVDKAHWPNKEALQKHYEGSLARAQVDSAA
jgi:hypothetical protein